MKYTKSNWQDRRKDLLLDLAQYMKINPQYTSSSPIMTVHQNTVGTDLSITRGAFANMREHGMPHFPVNQNTPSFMGHFLHIPTVLDWLRSELREDLQGKFNEGVIIKSLPSCQPFSLEGKTNEEEAHQQN